MLLEVNNLSVSYPEFTLHPVSFALDAGEMLTIVGESGSGKTTLARAIACLSEPEAQVSGQVYLNGRELLAMDERARRPLRMKEFALSFQNSAEWLNPSLTLAEHLREVLCRAYRGAAMAARMEELMALVGLETADLERYPRELSGGMVQKFLLANALALNPALVLLDEPTGALDIASSRGITALIQELNRRLGTAFLVITHDMKLAADLGGRTVVLYDGHVEEAGDTRALLDHPRHPYTRALTMEPALLIADEPTSMLDPSGKANLLRMLKGLQNNRGFSMLFITHDLDSALKISDRLFRLEKGALTRLNPNDYIQVRFDGLFDAG